MLAAVNPDPSEAELNRTIIEIAASMTKLYGGELHLAHAWELYGEATMRESAFIHTPAAELETLLHDEEVSHRAALDDLLSAQTWPMSLGRSTSSRAPRQKSCQRSSPSIASTSWSWEPSPAQALAGCS